MADTTPTRTPFFGPQDIKERFGFHKSTPTTIPQHEALRTAFISFANFLDEQLPGGRAKSVALTELENAAMWAHKSVASRDPVEEPRSGH